MKYRAIALATAICAIAQPGFAAPAAQDVDVIGIKFGMTPDQVVGLLAKANPQSTVLGTMKYKPGPGNPEGIASLDICAVALNNAASQRCSDAVVVAFTAGTQKAFFIRRVVAYNGTLTQQSLKEAVQKKYGFDHAAVVRQFGGQGITLYGAMGVTTDGKVSYARINPAGCDTAGNGPVMEPTRANGNCAWAMVTHSSAMSGRPDLLDSLTLAVTSHETLMRSLQQEQAARDGVTQKQRAEQDKRVQTGAPKL